MIGKMLIGDKKDPPKIKPITMVLLFTVANQFAPCTI